MCHKRHQISEELLEKFHQAGETAREKHHQHLIEKWGGQDAARKMEDETHHLSHPGRHLTAGEHAYAEGFGDEAHKHGISDWKKHLPFK